MSDPQIVIRDILSYLQEKKRLSARAALKEINNVEGSGKS